ncbi:type B 50S ribosomal protein L31 [Sulfidibacter corallicola]|uniref:50S ribosomal protein L31 n=1 Tax=Sulfidibacter corallicola TaxID=2818388 RepID=A0A8A4TK97_SULCO|nr:type B 50S ribosomal protein L31 [Sulfidibacter corallicola]QTD49907.1 type B 50S ribosomal protein L31 [Sulfidibacter corallicola]
MKQDIQPEYHPVVFVDSSTGAEFVTASTMKSDIERDIDGVKHYEVRLEITSDSHPYWTGNQKLVDTEGRVERFRRKYSRKKA